jgi:hypothetical protein
VSCQGFCMLGLGFCPSHTPMLKEQGPDVAELRSSERVLQVGG